MNGVRGVAVWASWCSGTRATTTGWKDVGGDAADQYDRRCDQPLVRVLCGQRLDGGEQEPAGEVREEVWAAAGLLHRQGVPVSNRGENETGWESRGKGLAGGAADTDRPGVAGVGNHLDTSAQSAGEREGRTRIFDRSGPAGEGHARGWRGNGGDCFGQKSA